MSDLFDIERQLPAQLHELASTIGPSGLTRAGVDRRLQERTRMRRMRRAIGSGSVAVAVFAGVAAFALQDQDSGGRIVTGGTGGVLAPAAQPPGPVDDLPPAPPPTESLAGTGGAAPPVSTIPSTVVQVPVDASPDQKPVGAQTPDRTKNAPAPQEPAADSGVSGPSSSVAPAPPETQPGPTIPIDPELAVVADPQPPWAGEPDSSCTEWLKHPSGLYSSRCVTRSDPP